MVPNNLIMLILPHQCASKPLLQRRFLFLPLSPGLVHDRLTRNDVFPGCEISMTMDRASLEFDIVEIGFVLREEISYIEVRQGFFVETCRSKSQSLEVNGQGSMWLLTEAWKLKFFGFYIIHNSVWRQRAPGVNVSLLSDDNVIVIDMLVWQSRLTTSTSSTMLFSTVAQRRFQPGESTHARPRIEVSAQRLWERSKGNVRYV